MTAAEKISQMRNSAPAIPRLNLSAYDWWSEGLHGLARNGQATVFPQAIGLAATWDRDLVRQVGDVVSTEARAKFNTVGKGDHGLYGGLNLFAPNINIFRDPRWGRGQETYGEDPYLTGKLAVAFIGGIQGSDPDHPKAIATAKHLAVHSGPESGRHGFDVDVSPYDLETTYLPAFRRAVVEGKVQSVMCAYNSIEGAPACGNDMLLQRHLRTAWGFTGFVASDCGAVDDMAHAHFFAATTAEASAKALRAGTDLDCGWEYGSLDEALKSGLINDSDLDLSLGRLFAARRRLGMDGSVDLYAAIGADQIHTRRAAQLALEAARESIVLLKNNGVLPLKTSARLAVIGPDADAVEVLEGNYHGVAVNPVTPLAGLRGLFPTVAYAQGAPLAENSYANIPETALQTGAGPGGAAGLVGEYFDNPTFSGNPRVVRVDRTLDFDLDRAAPAAGLEKAAYSVRWKGYFIPPAAGDYRMNVRLDQCWNCVHDQVRLFINEQPVEAGAVLHFDEKRPQRLRLEFAHVGADSGLRLQWMAPQGAQLDEAAAAIDGADAIVAFVGLSPDVEGEELGFDAPGFAGGDRTSLDLPAPQQKLLETAKASGKPVIVVLMSGGAVALNWAKAHADAVLTAWYPGEAGGTAIAETLSGRNNPSGRLPVTFYQSARDLPAFIDYRMAGRTYRYFNGTPLFPFGYGLSYSRFSYSGPSPDQTIQAGQPVRVKVTVANISARAGDEVAQVYMTPPADAGGLKRALIGFQRLHLAAGQSHEASFDLDPRDLSLVDAHGERAIEPGVYHLFIGGGQPGEAAGVEMTLTINGRMALKR
ncbi:glycoside hydrolase family 3 C-terminal domain-containing protein [Phenylobacterium montanum]|uniref:Glycoside hydrolase family 3 C-terminal domain-containing protein n=2 Tax=Phenylobacterium montanum TaxID=2823693 RepID=A0A975G570_9CAUL|nr:glycoside hydrolase family 3 C-terminal domain-containing protein [Caulobacter sp. S6]